LLNYRLDVIYKNESLS